MDSCGVYITGILAGMEVREQVYDGEKKTVYRYLIVAGMESYLVSSDSDYTSGLSVGSTVTFCVVPRVYNNKIYFSKGVYVN